MLTAALVLCLIAFQIPATDHDKLKEDLSLITEEERSVLEALTYMHKTPERRITTDSDASVTSLPENVPAPATKQETLHDALATSPQNELDAVQALLSFREAGSQMPVIPKKPTIQLKYKNVVTPSESALLVALAKEHNYFVQCNPRRLPSTDPVAAQVLEEHNYRFVEYSSLMSVTFIQERFSDSNQFSENGDILVIVITWMTPFSTHVLVASLQACVLGLSKILKISKIMCCKGSIGR